MWVEKNKNQSSYVERSKNRLKDFLLKIDDVFTLDIGSGLGLLIDEGVLWTEREKDGTELTTAGGAILLTAGGEQITINTQRGWNERNKS